MLCASSGAAQADLPAPGAGRADLRRPRRDRPRHPGGHRPAQRPRPALDLGTAPAQTPLLPTALYIHPLRNVALAVADRLAPPALAPAERPFETWSPSPGAASSPRPGF